MKTKHYLATLLLWLFAIFAHAQQNVPSTPCLTGEIMGDLLKNNPELKSRVDLMNVNLSPREEAGKITTPLPMITIPVVVYIVHDAISNITDNQVNSQIIALNTYFNPYGINFCLATKVGTAPIPTTGIQNTPGIIHINNPAYAVHNSQTDQGALLTTSDYSVTASRYLRIWVVKSIAGSNAPNTSIMGYAYYPGMGGGYDGIVMRYDAFGNSAICPECTFYPNSDQGKILVHEVGHYLGLYHTFEGGCSGNGDYVDDTPAVAAPNYSCAAGTDSCTGDASPDLIHNYMDYGNDTCSDSFTPGQKARMFSMLSTYRSLLYSSDNLIYTGACGGGALLSGTFTPTSYSPCTNSAVTFNPLTPPGSGITYSWDFGDPLVTTDVSTASNPTYTYTSSLNSPYTVTFTISNGTSSVISTRQIFVTNCSPIVNGESNWYLSQSGGLKFHSGVPVKDASFPLNHYANECTANQSDAAGNMLFYTNGINVWNGAHAEINTGNLMLGHQSANTGVVIVPNPANSNQYYIFTKAGFENLAEGMRYSLVTMVGGLPTMTSATTNVPVTFPSGYLTGNNGALTGGEFVTAVQRCDNNYWIITSLQKSTGHYIVVYSLSAATGLTFNSEYSLPDGVYLTNSLRVSPNGNKLVYINHTKVVLFDFNKFTGVLSNDRELFPQSYGSSYGGSFSPDSRLFYINRNTVPFDANSLYQINTDSANPVLNRVVVATGVGERTMQIGPDNKIYIIIDDNRLGVIHKPNVLATPNNSNACLFTPDGPSVPNLYRALPNLINAKAATAFDNSISSYPTNCNTYNFVANVSCAANVSWNFGDTTNNTATGTHASHVFSGNGTFTVTLYNGATVVATKIISIGLSAPVIVGSTEACLPESPLTNNSIALQQGQSVTWSVISGGGVISGPNNLSNVTVNWTALPGTIQVSVTNSLGCTAVATQLIQSSCVDNGSMAPVYTTKLLTSGKIIFGGDFTSYNGTAVNRIARLNSDMSLDSGFTVGTGADGRVSEAEIQTFDNKIIIGGAFTSYNGNPRSCIARLNSNGTIDTGFTVGTGITGGSFTGVEDVAVLSNGILVGGRFTSYNGTSRINLVKLQPNGTIDTSFNSYFTGENEDYVSCIEVLSNGKIMVGGRFTTYAGYARSNIVRLYSNGTIDLTFDPGTGFEPASVGANRDVYALKILSDGKILVGGQFVSYNGVVSRCIARLNTTGALDTTFVPDFITILGGGSGVRCIDVQSSGKIIIGGGFANINGLSNQRIARLNASGTLDTSFNSGEGFGPREGRGSHGSRLYDVITQPDGKIITGGDFTSYNLINVNHITRITADNPNVIGKSGSEEITETGIVVFPNPSKDYFRISFQDKMADFVEIYNTLGQLVKTQKLMGDDIIYTENFKGLYYLKIYNKTKFVKSDKVILK